MISRRNRLSRFNMELKSRLGNGICGIPRCYFRNSQLTIITSSAKNLRKTNYSDCVTEGKPLPLSIASSSAKTLKRNRALKFIKTRRGRMKRRRSRRRYGRGNIGRENNSKKKFHYESGKVCKQHIGARWKVSKVIRRVEAAA